MRVLEKPECDVGVGTPEGTKTPSYLPRCEVAWTPVRLPAAVKIPVLSDEARHRAGGPSRQFTDDEAPAGEGASPHRLLGAGARASTSIGAAIAGAAVVGRRAA